MIHQLIFAHPKPGMSEQEFQRYWLDVHAPNYAAKIPQIRKYCVDTRIPLGPEPADPLWSGIAEIWLDNDEDQLASLQTPEFLEGARLDEPRWAAFWRTVVLDTDAQVLLPGPGTERPEGTKLVILAKRANGTTVEDFRRRSLEGHAKTALDVPGVVRYVQGFVRDGAYAIGESLLDVAYQLSFENEEALRLAVDSAEFGRLLADLEEFTEPRYIHQLAVREHWIIGAE
ncbi:MULTISPECIES: EthD family reductase [unclassified Kitasatospora]|uniref:EthD domain-containing protein n=1 Tax=unclassified Kitasatospora TaxID=2633591 RepID=UPI00070964A8|nr:MULTISPECIES: EthD family reductase [unclassified Kitasatospora]KQV15313.1 ethyl tert-butyl ether degradation protein EthD [Kitasatospora sp. Root107]KRB64098.1 ethyl tert-butyl ether degradation protein EthD [Kitasatospora sp. Root187]